MEEEHIVEEELPAAEAEPVAEAEIPKKRKMDPVLFLVLAISGGIHAVAALVFGSMVMYKAMTIEEPEFVAPPKKQAPPKRIQYKVQTQTKTKPKPRKITVNNVSKINMPKINVKMPQLRMKADFSNITSGMNMSGFGGGGLGGTGKSVSLLKVQARGERFLFMVDAGSGTMTAIKGGFDGFDTIRKEILSLVKSIPPAIVFNMGFFERTRTNANVLFFKPSLLAATDGTKLAFEKWIHSINSEKDFQNGKVGLGKSNWRPSVSLGRNAPAELIIIQASIEQKADVVFLINGGWRNPYAGIVKKMTAEDKERSKKNAEAQQKALLAKGYTAEKKAEWLNAYSQHYNQYAKEFKAYLVKNRIAGVSMKGWVHSRYGSFKGIVGLPPVSRAQIMARGGASSGNYEEKEVLSFLKAQQKKAYEGIKNKKLSMNAIVFIGKSEKDSNRWTDSMEKSVRGVTRDFNGKFRLLVSDVEAVVVGKGATLDPKEQLKVEAKLKKYEDQLKKEKNKFNIDDLKAKIAALKKQLNI